MTRAPAPSYASHCPSQARSTTPIQTVAKPFGWVAASLAVHPRYLPTFLHVTLQICHQTPYGKPQRSCRLLRYTMQH